MSSQLTPAPSLAGPLVRRWAINAVAGAAALLLGLLTGEWVCSPFVESSRLSSLPRAGGAALAAWAPTLVPVVCNLVALTLFAAVLVPLLRRRDKRREEPSWPTARAARLRAPAALNGGALRIEADAAGHRAEQERRQKEKDDMLRKVFEDNLSLRS